jgi:peroxiredoxin
VQILGISENHTFSQKAFADSLKLSFPLLSDRTLNVARAYGVLYGHTEGEIQYPHLVGRKAKRAFFLIDQQGIVRERWIGGDEEAFPNERLLQAARVLAGKS